MYLYKKVLDKTSSLTSSYTNMTDIEDKDNSNNKIKMSPLMSIKHILLSQSNKVKDIYHMTKHKQTKQQNQNNFITDKSIGDIIKENTINLLRERKELEIDKIKINKIENIYSQPPIKNQNTNDIQLHHNKIQSHNIQNKNKIQNNNRRHKQIIQNEQSLKVYKKLEFHKNNNSQQYNHIERSESLQSYKKIEYIKNDTISNEYLHKNKIQKQNSTDDFKFIKPKIKLKNNKIKNKINNNLDTRNFKDFNKDIINYIDKNKIISHERQNSNNNHPNSNKDNHGQSSNVHMKIKDVPKNENIFNQRKQKTKHTLLKDNKIFIRPQTPKIKKSIEIRNNLKQSATSLPPIKFKVSPIKSRVFPSAEIKTSPKKNNKNIKSIHTEIIIKNQIKGEVAQQLLHPLWRKIPHNQLYGWSDQHDRLESILYNMSKEKNLNSLYYKDDAEYNQAQINSGYRFLQKPIVNSVSEVLQLLQCYEKSPGTLPKVKQSYEENLDDTVDTESGYDGDSDD